MPVYNNRQITQLQKLNTRFSEAGNFLIRSGKVSSWKEMAAEMGVHAGNLADITNGKRNVPIDYLIAICRVYKVNPGFLLPPWEKEMFK